MLRWDVGILMSGDAVYRVLTLDFFSCFHSQSSIFLPCMYFLVLKGLAFGIFPLSCLFFRPENLLQ